MPETHATPASAVSHQNSRNLNVHLELSEEALKLQSCDNLTGALAAAAFKYERAVFEIYSKWMELYLMLGSCCIKGKGWL